MTSSSYTHRQTVVCAFDRMEDAREAIRDLQDAGISRDQISLVARGQQDDRSEMEKLSITPREDTTDGTSIGENVAAGTAIGGLGGLLIGLSALAIPGIGPVVAAGPLATTIAGALSGAVGGGIIGALKDAGVPDEDAHFYGETVRRGGAIVTVYADNFDEDRVRDILQRHNAIGIGDRTNQYREGGWSRFDETSGPYTGGTTGAGMGTSGMTGTGSGVSGETGAGTGVTTGRGTSGGDYWRTYPRR